MRKVSLSVVFFIILLIACVPKETFLTNSTPPSTATLDPTTSQKLIRDLLDNNAGCKLPCWWGITPGETTWVEARQILEKTSLYVGGQETETIFSASVHSYVPYPHDYYSYLEHLYGVNNGVVNYIQVFNHNLAPNYNLNNFLESYGLPNEVWMRTRAKAGMGIQIFTIDLFYKDKGMLLEYSTGNPLTEIDGKLQNCMIKDMDSPFIHLWSTKDQELSFQDAKKYIDTTNLPEPIPLLEATGMDIQTFYETFKNPDTDVCLETPKNLWP